MDQLNRTKIRFVYLLIAVLFTVNTVQAAISPTEVEGATTVEAATAKRLFDQGVKFVDVRTDSLYSSGHIPGAAFLNYKTTFNEAALAKIVGKDQEVVIYCDGPRCYRSSKACEKAVSWGFTKVYYFRDGYPGWIREGYPTEE